MHFCPWAGPAGPDLSSSETSLIDSQSTSSQLLIWDLKPQIAFFFSYSLLFLMLMGDKVHYQEGF